MLSSEATLLFTSSLANSLPALDPYITSNVKNGFRRHSNLVNCRNSSSTDIEI
jgi:hypothetical protein